MAVNIPETFGALLLGALLAAGLSGMVIIQSIIYFKLYPFDPAQLKTLVCVIWVLDMAHSVFICAAIWTYLIVDYGTVTDINSIPLSLALTITCTAILTFFVHCFFAQRIFRLSQFNWYITFPIAVLATFRLCSACVTSAEMIHLQSFTLFKLKFRWIFSLGLALSSSVDILITLSLFMLLRNSRTRSLSLNHIIDTLILYTFETGALTCAATITTMICWLSMNDNMVFMGLHFVIGKLYANSLLATLNTRRSLRRSHNHHANQSAALQGLDVGPGFDFEFDFNSVAQHTPPSAVQLHHAIFHPDGAGIQLQQLPTDGVEKNPHSYDAQPVSISVL